MTYHHPLAYLIGLEGLALLRAWGGDYDERFVRARLAEVRDLLADEALSGHPGVVVEEGATGSAYRRWAESYDDPGNDLLRLDLPVVDEVLDTLPAGTAVDAACGTGRLAARLAGRGHRVTGVDSSVAMLREARRQVPGIRFVAADVHRLPFPDGSADLVTCALALTHVADLRPVLAELARVLRPGGTAIVSDVHPELVRRGSAVKSVGPTGRPQLAATHVHPIGDHLRAALAAGFTVRRCEELPRPAGPGAVGDPPSAQPVREIGEWRDWPWTLLAWVPEATRAAWDNPAVVVWHLVLGPPSVRRGRP